MKNSLQPILFGHWAKDGAMSEKHCHFSKDECCNNTFCFEETAESLLPKSLIMHILKHFSYEGQWVLDLTESKGNSNNSSKKIPFKNK